MRKPGALVRARSYTGCLHLETSCLNDSSLMARKRGIRNRFRNIQGSICCIAALRTEPYLFHGVSAAMTFHQMSDVLADSRSTCGAKVAPHSDSYRTMGERRGCPRANEACSDNHDRTCDLCFGGTRLTALGDGGRLSHCPKPCLGERGSLGKGSRGAAPQSRCCAAPCCDNVLRNTRPRSTMP